NTLDEIALREWLVKNIKGIGYKEASHFLRNIGFTNLAIIDFHILNILTRHKLIKKPKTLTRKNYLEIEQTLKNIAEKLNLTLAELDLYLWYIETNKILK
ncbi:MAG: N-glycosylase, partial [Candidatus Bathyarchaeia archaeon]